MEFRPYRLSIKSMELVKLTHGKYISENHHNKKGCDKVYSKIKAYS
jgi:hypothetical protein